MSRPADLIFPHRKEHFKNKTCISCGESATEFRDELSRKEYTLSCLCQICQDTVFNSVDEEIDDDQHCNEQPTGKCLECGGLVFNGGNFCCEEHEKAFTADLMGRSGG